ncbi:hypothetical protein E4U59_002832 [Claviceps monticola]|nr:hypothetical protein E4U59_002832 [Claviceps monticola]
MTLNGDSVVNFHYPILSIPQARDALRPEVVEMSDAASSQLEDRIGRGMKKLAGSQVAAIAATRCHCRCGASWRVNRGKGVRSGSDGAVRPT